MTRSWLDTGKRKLLAAVRRAQARFKVPYSGVSNRLGREEIELVTRALRQDTLCLGAMNQQFESEFAAMLGARHAQATNSCTTALFLAAQVLGLKEGDEVITTPQTFWMALWPLLSRRCKIRFADIDADSFNIDPTCIRKLVNEKTKSIWVVHYGGQPADMDPIMEIAGTHRLSVVEDCAHAAGATYKGRKVGTIGDIGCFSFGSLKNITTGEGGAFVTANDRYAEMARPLGTLQLWGKMVDRTEQRIGPYSEPSYYKDWHAQSSYTRDFVKTSFEVGNNFRMSELNAALGIAQLRKLDRLNERRREIARRLDEGLSGLEGISLQQKNPYVRHVHHLYTCFYHPETVGAPKDDFIRYLELKESVQIQIRYFPVHLLPEFRALGHYYGECPVAERQYFEHQIQLPIYGHLTKAQINHMIGAVKRGIKELKGGKAPVQRRPKLLTSITHGAKRLKTRHTLGSHLYGTYKGKAVVFTGPRKAELWDDVAFPIMDHDGVVIETKYSTISRGTEMDLYTGQMHNEGSDAQTYPLLPGYISVGTVIEIGRNIRHLKVGDPAIGSNLLGGLSAPLCCAWGGHSQYLVLSRASYSLGNLFGTRAVRVPDCLPLEAAGTVLLGGIAYRGIQKVNPQQGETVLVIGQGVVGIYAALLSKLRGARVITTDLCPERLEIARAMGIEETIDASKELMEQRIKELTGNAGPNVIIEATGEPALLQKAFDMIAVGGRVHAQGAYLTPLSIRLQSYFAKEFTLTTTCGEHPDDTARVFALLREHKIDIAKLVTDVMPVDRCHEAYELAFSRPDEIMTLALKWK